MNELFNIPPVLSPRLKWIEKHGVYTSNSYVSLEQPEMKWIATAAGKTALGKTEDDAIVNLAKKMGTPLWNEE